MSILSELIRIVKRKPPTIIDLGEIHDIEIELIRGELEAALEKIDKLTKLYFHDNLFAVNYLHILKMRFYAELNKVDELSKVDLSNSNHPVITNTYIIEQANILRVNAKFSDAQDSLEVALSNLEDLKFIYQPFYLRNKARINNLKSKIFNKSGKYDQSIVLLNEAMEIYNELGYSELVAEPLNDIGISYAQKGESDKTLEFWQRSLDIYRKEGNRRQVLKLYNNLGLFNYNIGNLDAALLNLQKSLELSEEIQIKQYSASILLNMGLIYQDKGNINDSIEYFDRALELFEELDNKGNIAQVKMNQGNIYQLTGDFDKSIKLYKESQEILEELDLINELGILYNSLASSYHLKGQSQKGLSLVKEAVNIHLEIGNYNQVIHSLYNTVEISVQLNKMDVAEEYLDLFEQELPNIENPLGHQLYKLAKALILTKSDRVVKRAEAQTILSEIADEEIISVTYTIKAYQKLAELLLQELKLSASEEALKEFKDLINRLDSVTKGSDAGSEITPSMVDVLILRSKLALIDLNVEKAQSLLDEAHELAKVNGLKELVKLVKQEKLEIKNQMMNYKKMVDNNASLYERLQESQIENYLKRAEGILKK